MYVVRPALTKDVDSLFELIQEATYGLTTLQVSHKNLFDRVEKSVYSFSQNDAKPEGQPYVFVLENTNNGRIVGTATIYSKVGGFEPFYSYQIKTERKVSKDEELGFDVDIEVPYLSLLKQHDGPTEIGSLYLARECWGGGLGRLLSLSRFLFIAQFSKRFEKEVVAEMRGVVDKHGESPLWNALGIHFFVHSFPQAESLTTKSKKLIAELMPENEIYIPLLPKEAQEVIGQVHDNTRPALELLKQEGFEYRNIVDIFDGGPSVHCQSNQIRTVCESQEFKLVAIEDHVDGDLMLISNTDSDFRVAQSNFRMSESKDGAIIDAVTALRLKLVVGGRLRCVTPKPVPLAKSESI